MGQENNMTINANPTKRFFIDMLVRDIDLKPAIAELVDNSLDGVKKLRKNGYTNTCDIKVKFDKEQFVIEDTCGGISIDDAQNYCFRFGRDSRRDYELSDGTGVFGIGMKRALFRMGKVFDIVSYTPTEHFKIHIDVDEWIKDTNENWTFSFTDVSTDDNNPIDKCGTYISVTKLHDSISSSFDNPYFRNAFFNYIQMRSSMIKQLDVAVLINSDRVQYTEDKILFSDMFKPYVKSFDLDGVNVKIIAGCAKMGEPKKAGWYVQCNGRTVLFANQDEDTGWGSEGVRSFHRGEFATFRGYVLFESSDLEKLPWNTTKTGVDFSSKYYQKALDIMRDCERIYIEFRDKVDEFVKTSEDIQTDNIFQGNEVTIFSPTVLNYSESNYQYQFPELSAKYFPAPPEPMTSITFKETKKRVAEVKENMGNVGMTNKGMGENLFNYFYEREIDEDE